MKTHSSISGLAGILASGVVLMLTGCATKHGYAIRPVEVYNPITGYRELVAPRTSRFYLFKRSYSPTKQEYSRQVKSIPQNQPARQVRYTREESSSQSQPQQRNDIFMADVLELQGKMDGNKKKEHTGAAAGLLLRNLSLP